jgi:hypothetical protein
MSNHDIDRVALQSARATLADAAQTRRRLIREITESLATVERLIRSHGSDDERVRRARDELAQRERGLEQAETAAARARRELSGHLADSLPARADDEIARLGAEFPIALFPVRIETRFATSQQGAELRVRLYPDTILAETHDPLLTDRELAAGKAYWARAWADQAEEAQAWRDLVSQTPAPRAAWIVRACEPVNIGEQPEGTPVFPVVELRTGSWDRAPEAALLPDRWIVLAYRNDVEVRRASSSPVQEPLALGFDPHTPPNVGVNVSGDGLVLDEGLAWTVDFALAEAAGMGLRIAIDAQDAQLGFDRVLVIGVKGSVTPEEAAAQLGRHLDGRHYSHGFAFVAQGAPTNNSETASTAFPPPDPDGGRSFAVERGNALDTEDGDGVRVTRAFGVSRHVVAHIEGADRTQQLAARAMNEALWPATWGYFLEQMMAPHVSGADVAEARRYFVEHVRGRGPLPAFRVAAQPYGILPVTSVDRWEARVGATGADVELPRLLRRLHDVWRAQIENVPRVGRTQNADADLLEVLGTDASTREVRVRRVHGPDFQLNLLGLLSIDSAAWLEAHNTIAQPSMNLIGFPTWTPRILGMNFADNAARFRFPFIAPGPLSEESGLEAVFGFDYIRWIREASLAELRDETLPEDRSPPTALLYRMLRHARLAELQRVAVGLQITHGLAPVVARLEPELIGIADVTVERPTIWQRFEQPIPELTGTVPLGTFLLRERDAPETTTLREYDDALAALEGLPTAELDRLFTETLDLCSHRFDAWATSMATKRLGELRAANPFGTHIGAFGWVEDLRPAPSDSFREETLDDGRTVRISLANAGHIHAPSMQHAAAAAVLRNGHLTRSGEQGTPYAVDLSSVRVRTALSLLDAVREGQPFGAVLGYRFERELHDRGLDKFIEPMRRRFPLMANKAGDAQMEGAPETIAARSVVDGLTLRNAWQAGSIDLDDSDFASNGVPPTADEKAAVLTQLQRLEQITDAAADLLTAEAVYQIIGGDTGGANASLDTLGKGARPPDLEVAHPPRTGIPLSHRVGVVLGADALAPIGWEQDLTPRALAEPHVDGWAGQLIGDPRTVKCRVRFVDSSAPPDAAAEEEDITLAALHLRPIDVLSLAQTASEGPAPVSELDQRVAAAARAEIPQGARVTEIVYARHPAWALDEIRSVPEILQIARTLNQLLTVARPMTPADIVTADVRPLLPETDAQSGQENSDRATKARQTLGNIEVELTNAIVDADAIGLRQVLLSASRFGIPGAFPMGEELSSLVAQADAILPDVRRRVADSAVASDPVAIAKAVFGRDFPFLPRFSPPQPEELQQALAAGAVLAGDAQAPKLWMYQAARVRPALAKWRKLSLLSEALGNHTGSLDVVQLPHREGARWVALLFPDDAEPVPGTLSIVLHRLAKPQADQPWVGLLLDEWDEIVPHKEMSTGISFHFDTPGAEAPQAVLLAVPPTNAETWTLDTLVAVLHETIDLAKMRGVDGELLGLLGQLAPAIYLAGNVQNDAVSTDFGDALVADHAVLLRG